MKALPRYGLAAAFLAMSVGCQAGGGSTILTAAAVGEQVDRQGAKSVVRELRSDEAKWDFVMARIAAGEGPWLDAAMRLRPGTDAGSTSELQSALFLALEKNAGYVLKVANEPPYLLGVVCGGRDDQPDAKADALAELRRAESAVARVKEPELGAKKALCMSELKKAQEALK